MCSIHASSFVLMHEALLIRQLCLVALAAAPNCAFVLTCQQEAACQHSCAPVPAALHVQSLQEQSKDLQQSAVLQLACCAGVVCDKGLTLRDLIGTLKMFFDRLGLKKLRFKPAYNPYTEPSMEIFRCEAVCTSSP